MSTRLDAEQRDEQVGVEVELGSSEPLAQLRALYDEDVREMLVAVRQRSGLTDEQALRLADEEGDALRSR